MKKIDKKSYILLSIIFLYLIFYCLFYNILSSIIDSVITPIFWIILSIVVFVINKENIFKFKTNINKLQMVFIIVITYLLIYFPTGFLVGYGKSIYAHDFFSIFKNIWQILIVIVFQEYIRNIILTNSKRSKSIFILTFIVYTLYSINLYSFFYQELYFPILFQKSASIIFPAIALNLLLNYMTINSGYFSCLIYLFPLNLAQILLPILPKADWFYTAISNTILPFIVFIVLKSMTDKKIETRERHKKTNYFKYIPIIIILIFFVLFTAGLLKYKPVAIMSNSMKPIFSRGDIVVIEKLNDKSIKNLKLYDIIEYRLDGILVVHRIINIENHNDGTLSFITKGDNNNAADLEKVNENQIIGKVRLSIPKIGYPSVFFGELFQKDQNVKVETGN